MEAMSAENGRESQVERNASRLQTQTYKSKEIEVALRPNLSDFYIPHACVERLSSLMNSLQKRDYFHHLKDVYCFKSSDQQFSVRCAILHTGWNAVACKICKIWVECSFAVMQRKNKGIYTWIVSLFVHYNCSVLKLTFFQALEVIISPIHSFATIHWTCLLKKIK